MTECNHEFIGRSDGVTARNADCICFLQNWFASIAELTVALYFIKCYTSYKRGYLWLTMKKEYTLKYLEN